MYYATPKLTLIVFGILTDTGAGPAVMDTLVLKATLRYILLV